MRILLAQLNYTIGDFQGNLSKMLAAVEEAKTKEAELVVFSELAVCGYPPEDFLTLPHFVDDIEKQLDKLIAASKGLSLIAGTVRRNPEAGQKSLFNSAAVIHDGQLIGFQDKVLLPTYDVFDECRYFACGGEMRPWQLGQHRVAITVCEDLWAHSGGHFRQHYSRDPVEELKGQDLDCLVNIASSPYRYGKPQLRLKVVQQAAQSLQKPVLFCNQVGGNDNLIFAGYSLVVGAEGQLIQHAKGFEEELLVSKVPEDGAAATPKWEGRDLDDLYAALVLGLRDYFYKSGFHKACFGLSGGIDSAVVACIAAEALGPEHVLALTMPSRFSSEGSVSDSELLAKNLGIEMREIPIEGPFSAYLELLAPEFEGKKPDVTEENLQARIRGMLLMAFSNKFGHVVLSTGNKSELAMGYSTLYGDMCGGLGVIGDVTKEQVYQLAEWINREQEIIPRAIIDKPPSAELRPDQKDSDSLPDYAIVDTVLQAYVEGHQSPQQIAEENHLELDLVEDLVRKIHRNEYKRRQSPPTLRVTEKAFSIGRRFPIVQGWV